MIEHVANLSPSLAAYRADQGLRFPFQGCPRDWSLFKGPGRPGIRSSSHVFAKNNVIQKMLNLLANTCRSGTKISETTV